MPAGQLVLIRHAEPAGPRLGIYSCHQGCPGLTPRGAEQAKRLGSRLKSSGELGQGIVVYTSRLKRARDTADIALQDLSAITWAEDCGVCELHGGDADGLTVAERESRFGPVFSVMTHPDRPVAPGGESWNDMIARAGAALRQITDRHPTSTTVVVTHAGVIAASFAEFGGIRVAHPRRVTRPPEFTSLTVWDWDEKPAAAMLSTYSDAAHLRNGEPIAAQP